MAKKLSEEMPAGTISNPQKADKKDWYGKAIVIVAISFSMMEKGEVARIVFHEETKDKYFFLLSGSLFVGAKLKTVIEKDLLPIECTLQKIGNSDDLS